MTTRDLHVPQTALVLAGVALAATACGSGGGSSTSGASTGATPMATHASSIVSNASVDGVSALVDGQGRTLYITNGDSPGHIRCAAGCTSFWKPVMASAQQARQATSAVHLRLTVVRRPDGGTQLAYAGHPLYTFVGEGPHQMRGNGFQDAFGGTHFTWSAATLGGAPSTPTSTGSGSGGSGSRGGGYGY